MISVQDPGVMIPMQDAGGMIPMQDPRAMIPMQDPRVMIPMQDPGIIIPMQDARTMIHVPGPGWAMSGVIKGPCPSGIKSPQAQTSCWGPGTHLEGILQPMEAEGRLIGLSVGAAPSNLGPIWTLLGTLAAIPFGGPIGIIEAA